MLRGIIPRRIKNKIMQTKLLSFLSFIAIVFIVSCSPKVAAPPPPVAEDHSVRSSKETFLFKTDAPSDINSGLTISKDMRHLMYSIKEKNKQLVVADGVRKQPFDELNSMMFSEDARSIVYIAREGNRSMIMYNEKEFFTAAPGESIPYIFWAKHNSDLGYLLRSGEKTYLNFRGQRSAGYDDINPNSIAVTPDGEKVSFAAVKGKKSVIVWNGKETAAYDEVGFPILRKNGLHLVYWAKDNGKAFVVIDGRKEKEYDRITSLIVNEEGSRYAYSAETGGKQIVVSNGAESEKYVYVHSLTFSPVSSRLMYAVETIKKDKEGFNQHIVLDGKLSATYETVVEESLYFSPDGQHSIFEAEIHDQFFVVFDGQQGPHVSDVLQATIRISPNNRVAYAAENDLTRFVITDQKKGPPAKEVFSVGFSPDNRRVVYAVQKKDNKEYMLTDRDSGPAYDNILGQGAFHFEPNGDLRYLALKGRDLYLVEENWK
jgi:WD40 repeat protein